MEQESVIQMAKEYGFDKDNWITVEWVMENPKEAVKIYEELGYEVGDYHMLDENWGEEIVE